VASFGAVSFGVRLDGIERAIDSDATVTHVPGGNANIVDVSGRGVLTLSLGLYFPVEAHYLSLEALVGTQATLTYADGTYPGALLKSLRRTWRNPVGGQTQATAAFILPG
jgi:hypothetical protein